MWIKPIIGAVQLLGKITEWAWKQPSLKDSVKA